MSLQNSTHPISLFLSLSREKGCVALATVCMGLATLLHLLFAWFAGGWSTALCWHGRAGKSGCHDAGVVGRLGVSDNDRNRLRSGLSVVDRIRLVHRSRRKSSRELAKTSLREPDRTAHGIFHRHRSGELAGHALSDVMLLQEFWIHDLRLILKSSLLILGGMLMMFFLSVKLAVVAVTAFPAVAMFSMLLGRKIRKKTSRATDELATSSVVVEEAIRGIAGIKTHTNEGWEKDRYARTLTDM